MLFLGPQGSLVLVVAYGSMASTGPSALALDKILGVRVSVFVTTNVKLRGRSGISSGSFRLGVLAAVLNPVSCYF